MSEREHRIPNWGRPTSRRLVLGGALAAGLAACAPDGGPVGPWPSGSATPGGFGSLPPMSPTSSPSAGASTSTASGSVSPTPSPSAALRTATVVMSGDLLWHNTLWFSAADDHRRTGKGDQFDFDPMFAMFKPILTGADLAIAHNEVPFAPKGGPYTGYPSFAAPPQIAPWMRSMGWRLATTASNHSLDQGFSGLVRTRELLTRNDIAVVGTYATAEQRATPVILDANGVKIAVVGGTYSLNGIPLPKGKSWCVSMWDLPNLKAQAAKAKQAGADIVMVQLHGGEEYQTKPDQAQVERATALTADPNVDLVFGEHVHVVQPITWLNGKPVIYGMGNLVAQHLSEVVRGYDGITPRVSFTEQPGGGFTVSKLEYIPTMVTGYGGAQNPVRLYPVRQALREGKGDAARLKASLKRTRAAVNLLGAAAGLTEA